MVRSRSAISHVKVWETLTTFAASRWMRAGARRFITGALRRLAGLVLRATCYSRTFGFVHLNSGASGAPPVLRLPVLGCTTRGRGSMLREAELDPYATGRLWDPLCSEPYPQTSLTRGGLGDGRGVLEHHVNVGTVYRASAPQHCACARRGAAARKVRALPRKSSRRWASTSPRFARRSRRSSAAAVKPSSRRWSLPHGPNASSSWLSKRHGSSTTTISGPSTCSSG